MLCLSLAAACGVPRGLDRPEEAEAREAMLAVLTRSLPIDAADVAARRLVTPDTREEGGRIFRPLTDAELSDVWIPEPVTDLRIEGMNCRFHPVWSVTYRPVTGSRTGPPLVADLVLGEGLSPGETALSWKLVGHPWPVRRGPDGSLAPDFRPLGRRAREDAGPDGRRIVVVYPPWAITR